MVQVAPPQRSPVLATFEPEGVNVPPHNEMLPASWGMPRLALVGMPTVTGLPVQAEPAHGFAPDSVRSNEVR